MPLRHCDRQEREKDGRAKGILEGLHPGREEYFRHGNAGKIPFEARSADLPAASRSGHDKGAAAGDGWPHAEPKRIGFRSVIVTEAERLTAGLVVIRRRGDP